VYLKDILNFNANTSQPRFRANSVIKLQNNSKKRGSVRILCSRKILNVIIRERNNYGKKCQISGIISGKNKVKLRY